ncbi:MAG: polyprenyl synthetase family protein [Candidatus Methanofastidiosia archaeon]
MKEYPCLQFLKEMKYRIDDQLLTMLTSDNPYLQVFLYDIAREFIERGGKRFRPALCLLSCELVGGNPDNFLDISCIFELFQSFALIHDDIMDDQQMRRGKPASHRLYGVPLALNTGDLLFARAFEVAINRKDIDPATRIQILELLAGMSVRTVEGQAQEIGWIKNGIWDLGMKDYLRIVELKTGYYSAMVPLQVGVLLGGGTASDLKAMEGFGMNFAFGFQITDDLLNLILPENSAASSPDITEDQVGYGKEIGGDIVEGKRTLMVVHFMKYAPQEKRQWMKTILEKRENTPEEIKEAISLLKEYGSIDFAQKEATQYAEKAKTFLKDYPDSNPKRLLIDLTDFAVQRMY